MPDKLRILFVLSGNLSTTPRALKNIQLAKQLHHVKILKVNRNDYWNKIDRSITDSLGISSKSVVINRKNLIFWLYTSIAFKFYKVINIFYKKSIIINAFASNKIYLQIWSALKKNKPDFDLIIGQGSGALVPVYIYCKKNQIPFAFDVEDYHPGESTADQAGPQRRAFLMQKLLPHAVYVSFASPLIMQKTLELIGHDQIKNPILINNSFPQDEFQLPDFHLSPFTFHLKLVWFSQNINHSRGLEFTIEALQPFADRIHIYLIGQSRQPFHQQWIEPNQHFITTIDPMPSHELNLSLSQYDAGLAIEPGKDLNNNLALSNKIWAYLQSGIYIIATNTPAQAQFMQEYADHGMVIEPKVNAMQQAIEKILQNIDTIRAQKEKRFERAKGFSWEKEAIKLEEMWKKVRG